MAAKTTGMPEKFSPMNDYRKHPHEVVSLSDDDRITTIGQAQKHLAIQELIICFVMYSTWKKKYGAAIGALFMSFLERSERIQNCT